MKTLLYLQGERQFHSEESLAKWGRRENNTSTLLVCHSPALLQCKRFNEYQFLSFLWKLSILKGWVLSPTEISILWKVWCQGLILFLHQSQPRTKSHLKLPDNFRFNTDWRSPLDPNDVFPHRTPLYALKILLNKYRDKKYINKDTSNLGSIMTDIINVKVWGKKNRCLKARKQWNFDTEAKLMWKYKQV